MSKWAFVRTIRALDQSVGVGPHTLYWNGRDDAGRELPSGVYYVRLYTQGFSANRKVVLER